MSDVICVAVCICVAIVHYGVNLVALVPDTPVAVHDVLIIWGHIKIK